MQSSGKLAKAEVQVRFIFLILGIATLTCLNAILSEFFFFQHFYKKKNPNDIFTSINTGLNLSLLLLFQIFGAFISYTKQLILFQVLALITLISIPLVVIYLEESISYYIVCFFFGLIGISSALSNSSVFAIVSFFPLQNIVNAGVGQGLAGIISNCINFVILFFVGTDTERHIIISACTYFYISAGIILFSLILTFALFRNEFFLAMASKAGIIKKVDENTQENSQEEHIVPNEELKNEEEEQSNTLEGEKFSMFGLMKKIFVTAFMMFIIFFTTFLVFPGGILKPKLFNLPEGIKINIILFSFNLFDTIGRKVAGSLQINLKNLIFISISRIFLVFSIFYTAYQNEMGNINKYFVYALALINPALLALTNGAGCSLAFGLAPTQVPDSWKGRGGTTMTFFLVFGMFMGSISSLKFISLLDFKKS